MEDKYLKLSEEYLSGKMDPVQQQAFEKELETNPELRRALEETQFAMESVDIQAEKDLRNQFEEWKGAEPGAEVKPIKARGQRMMIGIAASLVVLFGAIFLLIPNEINNQQIAQHYYKAPEIAGTTLGSDNEYWQSGMKAYDQGKAEEAIASWEQISDPASEQQYFLGHAYFQVGEYSKTIKIMNELRTEASNYSDPALWYLCLSYLATDQEEDFKVSLERIISFPDHPFYRQAQQLEKEF